jgi:hypothetical protein
MIYKEKSIDNLNYMELVFKSIIIDNKKSEKLILCALNKVCKRGRFSHVVLVVPSNGTK